MFGTASPTSHQTKTTGFGPPRGRQGPKLSCPTDLGPKGEPFQEGLTFSVDQNRNTERSNGRLWAEQNQTAAFEFRVALTSSWDLERSSLTACWPSSSLASQRAGAGGRDSPQKRESGRKGDQKRGKSLDEFPPGMI